MIRGIIDRFEGEYAVIEIEGQMKIIRIDSLPQDVREGDVVSFEKNHWSLDRNATVKLQQHVKSKMEQLLKD